MPLTPLREDSTIDFTDSLKYQYILVDLQVGLCLVKTFVKRKHILLLVQRVSLLENLALHLALHVNGVRRNAPGVFFTRIHLELIKRT